MEKDKETKKNDVLILRTNPLDWGFPYWSTLFGLTSVPLFDVTTWKLCMMNLPDFLPCETCRLESSVFLYDHTSKLLALKTVKDCQLFLQELRDFVTKNILLTQTKTQEDVLEYVLRDDADENQKSLKFLKRSGKFPFFWHLDVYTFLMTSILSAILRKLAAKNIAMWVLDVAHLLPFQLLSKPTLLILLSFKTNEEEEKFRAWILDDLLVHTHHFPMLRCPLKVLLRRIVAPICLFYNEKIIK